MRIALSLVGGVLVTGDGEDAEIMESRSLVAMVEELIDGNADRSPCHPKELVRIEAELAAALAYVRVYRTSPFKDADNIDAMAAGALK